MYYVLDTGQHDVLIDDKPTIAYFQQRIGQVQIVRNDTLERLFYWIPDGASRPEQQKHIKRQVRKVMDACPYKEPKAKLEEFQLGVQDMVSVHHAQFYLQTV